MNRDEMLATLQNLHNALESADDVDQETRALLQTVTRDIEDVLQRGQDSDVETPPETLSEQLRETLIEFEARHPQIAGMLERITDGLSNLGI